MQDLVFYILSSLCEQINSLKRDILNLTPGAWRVSSSKCERSIFKRLLFKTATRSWASSTLFICVKPKKWKAMIDQCTGPGKPTQSCAQVLLEASYSKDRLGHLVNILSKREGNIPSKSCNLWIANMWLLHHGTWLHWVLKILFQVSMSINPDDCSALLYRGINWSVVDNQLILTTAVCRQSPRAVSLQP